MNRVLFVTGTRPEIIKMAPVYLKLRSELSHDGLLWCHTGQHDQVAREMFSQFGIAPDVVLDRPPGNGLAALVSGLLISIDAVLEELAPSLVFVHGDTSSTLAASLAAFYRGVAIAHIEAGLRSGNSQNPFPEESNRKIVGSLASRHYAPTRLAAENLQREGVPAEHIVLTGNTVVDAQNWIAKEFLLDGVEKNNILITMHRRENWPHIGVLCETVRELAFGYPQYRFVLPVHPNPLVSTVARSILRGIENVEVCEPLSYLELQRKLSSSRLAITDSGGIQEEAPGFHVPCIVLREKTERPEAIKAGVAELVGTDRKRIIERVNHWLSREPVPVENPFGDGQASQRILLDLKQTALVAPPVPQFCG